MLHHVPLGAAVEGDNLFQGLVNSQSARGEIKAQTVLHDS